MSKAFYLVTCYILRDLSLHGRGAVVHQNVILSLYQRPKVVIRSDISPIPRLIFAGVESPKSFFTFWPQLQIIWLLRVSKRNNISTTKILNTIVCINGLPVRSTHPWNRSEVGILLGRAGNNNSMVHCTADYVQIWYATALSPYGKPLWTYSRRLRRVVISYNVL